jgi:outer membrane protein assembly factor BamB
MEGGSSVINRRQLFAVLAQGTAVAGDWPQHLGPARNGLYPDTDFAWNSGPLRQAWTHTVGAGFAGPVAAGGRLFVFHRMGNEEVLEALEAKTGKPVWKSAYPTGYRDDFGFDEGPRAAPCVAGGMVYTYGAEGTLTAHDSGTGKRVWQRAAMKEFGAPKGYFGAACSPVVFDGRVLVGVGGANGGGIVAFDGKTGKTVWQALSDEAGYSSPVVAPVGGQPRAVFFTRTGLAVLDPSTGKVLAQLRWRSRSAASVNAATPIVSGSYIFLTASYGTGAVLLDMSSGSPKEVWSGDDSMSCHYATPVLHDGFLYGYHGRQEMGAELRCVEFKTGKVRWAQTGFGAGSILLVRNRILMVRETGQIVLAEAAPGAFRGVATHRAFEGTVRAYPAIAGGMLYVRDAGTRLAAFTP